mgnify:CR=1 FL=1
MSHTPALDQIIAAHGKGDLARAELLCRRMIASEPGNFQAWYMLAGLAFQQSHGAEALAAAEKAAALNPKVPSVVSVVAGRIADSGVDPLPHMRERKKLLAALPHAELLWASVREVLNIYQADECGCDIVTVPHEILNKAQKLGGVPLKDLSLDTVKMFAADAAAAGFAL